MEDPVLTMSNEFVDSAIVHFGVSTGIFDLTQSPRTAAELAGALGLRAQKLEPFLHALAGMRLLDHHQDRYTRTEAAARYLASDSAESIRALFGAIWADWLMLLDLNEWLTRRHPDAGAEDDAAVTLPAEELAALGEQAALAASWLSSQDWWAGCHTVVEIGAGHGRYAAGLRAAQPGLAAETWAVWAAPAPAGGGLAVPPAAGPTAPGGPRMRRLNTGPGSPLSWPSGPVDGVVLSEVVGRVSASMLAAVLAAIRARLAEGAVLAVVAPCPPGVQSPDRCALGSLTAALRYPRAWHPSSPADLTAKLAGAGFEVPEQRTAGEFLILRATPIPGR